MTQHITNADIVRNVRAAIKDGTLGAMNGYFNCKYVYGDDKGTRCAIGACLSPPTLEVVKGTGLNMSPVPTLLARGVVSFEDVDVALVTQSLHDNWAQSSWSCPTFSPPKGYVGNSDAVNRFMRSTRDLVPNQQTMERWLDVVEGLS